MTGPCWDGCDNFLYTVRPALRAAFGRPPAGSNAARAGNRPHRSYQVGSEGDLLVFVEGGDAFTMREGATWRWRPREDGSFEVATWRDGTSLGVAVVPASVGPGETST